MYSERFENKATVRAGELIKAGAIGKVLQTTGLGPHRINPKTRPQWFFDRKYFGGIITDIGSHQFDQFLFFTNSNQAEIVSSQIGNVAHPQYPNARVRTPLIVKLDAKDDSKYLKEWFGPIAFVIATDSTAAEFDTNTNATSEALATSFGESASVKPRSTSHCALLRVRL